MTEREELIEALNEAFSCKYHSVAQYLIDAHPYVAAGGEAILRAIEAVAAADRDGSQQLARAIEQLESVPQLVTIDASLTSLNYLAVDYVLAVLIEKKVEELAQNERLALLAESWPPVAPVATRLRDQTREQLDRLRALAA